VTLIVVAGEALVDLVPRGPHLEPLPGGSPYNVAIALGRLRTPVGFLGRCSTDGFGHTLRERLGAEGVDLALTELTDEPTTLALVHLDDQGQASYGFYLEGTSSAGMTELPRLAGTDALHVSLGAVTLETVPAGETLRRLVEREADRRVVSLDPNVRPRVIADLASYAESMERLVASCALVKVSEEDLGHLFPDQDVEGIARRWAQAGPQLVVVTRGADGVVAFDHAGGEHRVDTPQVTVVDTVGAGDAFTAGLLAGLQARGRLGDRETLAATDADQLAEVLGFAARVAAVACTRPGADPPHLDDVPASRAGR
jgi:fructokinase